MEYGALRRTFVPLDQPQRLADEIASFVAS